MNEYYQRISDLCLKSGITVGKMCSDLNIRQSVLSDLKTGRTKKLSTETLGKIAAYFEVSMDALLGNFVPDSDTISEDDIKAAFWGGEKALSQEDLDAMWGDVKRFAAFVAQQKKQEKQKHD